MKKDEEEKKNNIVTLSLLTGAACACGYAHYKLGDYKSLVGSIVMGGYVLLQVAPDAFVTAVESTSKVAKATYYIGHDLATLPFDATRMAVEDTAQLAKAAKTIAIPYYDAGRELATIPFHATRLAVDDTVRMAKSAKATLMGFTSNGLSLATRLIKYIAKRPASKDASPEHNSVLSPG